jgi:hypothetical protein
MDTRKDSKGRNQPAHKPPRSSAQNAKASDKPAPTPTTTSATGNGGNPTETAKAMAAQHAAAAAAGNDCDLEEFKSAVAFLAGRNRERSFKMNHSYKEYDEEPAEKFVTAVSAADLEDACDFLRSTLDAVEDAERKAKKAKQIAKEAKNPEKAFAKAREAALADAMEDDLKEAQREAKEDGECWANIKDDWIANWQQDHWGDEQEAEFDEEFRKNWLSDHGTPFPGVAAVNPPSPAKQREAGARP